MDNKILDVVSQVIDKAKSAGADEADAIMLHNQEVSVCQRLGTPEHIERAESQSFGVRVLIADKGGYKQSITSSTDSSEKAISEMVERAVEMAKISPTDEYIALADSELLANSDIDLDLYDDNEPSTDDLKLWASEAEEEALNINGVNNSEGADASYSHDITAFANSKGFFNSYNRSILSVSTSVVAGEGNGKETDYDYSVAHHRSDVKSAKLIGQTAGQRTVRKLNPRKVKTCQVPVVFESRISRSLLSSLAGAINGENVAKGTTFLADKLNQPIFSKDITIHDNPLLKRQLGSQPFDAEGVSGKDIKIIEDGVLTSWLLDIRSANKLGLTTTGHSSRSTSSMSHPHASNFYMENGAVSFKELMNDIKSGFFVTDTFGMGINGVTGDYSQGASGFWIENGEIAYPVSEITIAGNLLDMFKNMVPANDLEFNFATNCPTLRVEGMTIAGT